MFTNFFAFLRGDKDAKGGSKHNNELQSVYNAMDRVQAIIQFRPDGSREFEVNYIDGLESGSFKRWFKNGKLWVDENYFAGKLNGISKIFYLDGKVQVQSGYQAGKKNGLENAWYDNGQLRWQVVYENGIIKNKLRWKRDGSPSNQDPPKIF